MVTFVVHPAEARAGVEKGGHADSTWSCVNGLQTGRSACPPASCITPSASAAITPPAPTTRAAKRSSPSTKTSIPAAAPPAGRTGSGPAARSNAASGPCPSAAAPRSWPCPSRTSNAWPAAWCARSTSPFADPRRSYTSAFERYALELSRRMTIRDVAMHLDVSWDVIKDILKRDLGRRYAKPKLKHLRRIAIDEIAVAKVHRYLTVVMDLESGAGVFVGDGKGADALKPFWKRLRPSQAKIEAVVMDMSAAYRQAVSTHLPGAKIVF